MFLRSFISVKATSCLLLHLCLLSITIIYTNGDNGSATCSQAATEEWMANCPAHMVGAKALRTSPMEKSSDNSNSNSTSLMDIYRASGFHALDVQGPVANSIMATLRDNSKMWNAVALRHVLTYMCVKTSNPLRLNRCVASASPYAIKDLETNACVVVKSDPNSCAKNTTSPCEQMSNCKWHDVLPTASTRLPLFTESDQTAAIAWMESEYLKTLAPLVLPGVILALFLIAGFITYVIMKCFFNRFGGPTPRPNGYTKCAMFLPITAFIFCSAVVFICTLIMLAQNINISEQLSTVLGDIDITLENIDIFAQNLNVPVLRASKQLTRGSTEVSTSLKDIEWIKQNNNILKDMVHSYITMYTESGPFPFKNCNSKASSSSYICLKCSESVCGKLLPSLQTRTETLVDQSHLKEIIQLTNLVDHIFNTTKANILSNLSQASKDIAALATYTGNSKQVVQVLERLTNDYSLRRGAMVMFIFFLGSLSCCMGLFAIRKGLKTPQSWWIYLFHVSWMLAFLLSTIGFMMGFSLLAVGAAWYDSCQFLNILQEDMTPYFPESFGRIMNTCLSTDQNNVLIPLGLDNPLAFSCQIHDLHAKLLVNPLNKDNLSNGFVSYRNELKSLSPANFSISTSKSQELIKDLNTAIHAAKIPGPSTVTFTSDTIAKPWDLYNKNSTAFDCEKQSLPDDEKPLCFMHELCKTGISSLISDCKQKFNLAYNYTLASVQIQNMISHMTQDFTGINNSFSPDWKYNSSISVFATTFIANLTSFNNVKLPKIMGGSVAGLLDEIEAIRCASTCNWFHASFHDVQEIVCLDLLGTTLAIATCILIQSIFLIPVAVIGVTLQKRLRGGVKPSYEELEKKVQQLKSTQIIASPISKEDDDEVVVLNVPI